MTGTADRDFASVRQDRLVYCRRGRLNGIRLAVLAAGISGIASAQGNRIDLESISLSTNLVARIVEVEDDILSAARSLGMVPSAEFIAPLPDTRTDASIAKSGEGEPEAPREQSLVVVSSTPSETGNGSIFANVNPEQLEPDSVVASAPAATDTALVAAGAAPPVAIDEPDAVRIPAEQIEPTIAEATEPDPVELEPIESESIEIASVPAIATSSVPAASDQIQAIDSLDDSVEDSSTEAVSEPTVKPTVEESLVEPTGTATTAGVVDSSSDPESVPAAPVPVAEEVETPDAAAAIAAAATTQQQKESTNETEPPVTEVAIAAPAVTQQQEESINEDEIILGWATAWSNNEVEDYLSWYSPNFVPSDPGRSREAWETLRRKRLKNKDIRIIVSNAEVYRLEGDTAEIRFTQRYTSKSYRDRVIKAITMENTDNGWKFLSEETLETLPFK